MIINMYKTRQGECWDEIAKAVYGSEKQMGFLMENNLPLLDTMIFSAGTSLNTPPLPTEQGDLPAWRRKAYLR